MCCFGCFGRIIALVLGLTFVLVMCSSVWAFNMYVTMFEADTYTALLDNQDIYEEIPPLVLQGIAEASQTQTDVAAGQLRFADVVENLDSEDWEMIAREIVPPTYLQAQVERNLPIWVDYLNLERNRLDIVWDTSVILDNLQGAPGDQMVGRIYDSWSGCTIGEEEDLAAFFTPQSQVAQLVAPFAVSPAAFPYCQPRDAALAEQTRALLQRSKDEVVAEIVAEVPRQWVLREEIASNTGDSLEDVDYELYRGIQENAILFRDMFPLIFLIPSAFLALIVIVTVRSAKAFFGWMGWPLALAGLTALLPLFLIVPAFVSLIDVFGDNGNQVETQALDNLARAVVVQFTSPIFIQGAVLAVIGFVALVISALLPPPEEFDDNSGSGSRWGQDEHQNWVRRPIPIEGATPPLPPLHPNPPPGTPKT